MAIQNFPVSLIPLIQQGFLEREFQQALRSKLCYRDIADRVGIPVAIGESVTKTRAGLKPAGTQRIVCSILQRQHARPRHVGRGWPHNQR